MKSSTAFTTILALVASAAFSSAAAAPGCPSGCSASDRGLINAGLDERFCSAYLQTTTTITGHKTCASTSSVCPPPRDESSKLTLPPDNLHHHAGGLRHADPRAIISRLRRRRVRICKYLDCFLQRQRKLPPRPVPDQV